MEEIARQIKERGGMPSRTDIAAVLALVGPPGTKQAEKRQAVEDLFTAVKRRPYNSQGHSVLDELSEYEAW